MDDADALDAARSEQIEAWGPLEIQRPKITKLPQKIGWGHRKRMTFVVTTSYSA